MYGRQIYGRVVYSRKAEEAAVGGAEGAAMYHHLQNMGVYSLALFMYVKELINNV